MVEGTLSVRTEDIVRIARSWLGTPYHHQASLKGVGTDCVGLVRGIYRELYNVEPPELINYSADWGDSNGNEDMVIAAYKYLEPVPLDQLGPGHVVMVRWKEGRVAKHSMIMTGSRSAIHAYNRSPVTEITLNDWWMARIVHGFSFPEEVK
jgi:NlpC/P60 family putative phage cell wall peptidase